MNKRFILATLITLSVIGLLLIAGPVKEGQKQFIFFGEEIDMSGRMSNSYGYGYGYGYGYNYPSSSSSSSSRHGDGGTIIKEEVKEVESNQTEIIKLEPKKTHNWFVRFWINIWNWIKRLFGGFKK